MLCPRAFVDARISRLLMPSVPVHHHPDGVLDGTARAFGLR